jgi:hypothetical protein
MDIHLSGKEFRYLLDLVYAGNWVLNSTRGEDRIKEYDELESKIFEYCQNCGLPGLAENIGEIVPSREYVEGGIHEAIMEYEDMVFFGILAEELARRDLQGADVDGTDNPRLVSKIEEYMEEFTKNGIENVEVNGL